MSKQYSPKETVELLAKHLKSLIEKHQKGELIEENLEKDLGSARDGSASEITKPVNTKALIGALKKKPANPWKPEPKGPNTDQEKTAPTLPRGLKKK